LQSRQWAITEHHRADGRSSSIVAPTGDHRTFSRRQAFINFTGADGRPLIIVAPTGVIYFMRCANVRP
jgi:hypothetical protein